MAWITQVPNSHRTSAGYEWKLLRQMPHILVAGTLLPVLVALLARALTQIFGGMEVEATLKLVDIYTISAVILHWTAVLTVTIACVINSVMKGPVHTSRELCQADLYPLPDSESLVEAHR